MDTERRWLLLVTVLGGAAVLGSYVHGLGSNPETRGLLWGAVPAGLRPWYTVNMFLAAAGFLAFTFFLVFATTAARARVGGRPVYGVFLALYLLVLIPSALWMPLTFAMIDAPSRSLWTLVRLDLALVGIGAVGIVGALLALSPRQPRAAYWAAVLGSVPFAVQTAVLDALVWPMYFPVPD